MRVARILHVLEALVLILRKTQLRIAGIIAENLVPVILLRGGFFLVFYCSATQVEEA